MAFVPSAFPFPSPVPGYPFVPPLSTAATIQPAAPLPTVSTVPSPFFPFPVAPAGTQPALVEPAPSGAGLLVFVFFLGVLLVGVAVYSFFPRLVPPEAPIVEQAFEVPGNFPDFQIVSQSTQPINQWYLTPLEEENTRIPIYPYHQRIFHDPANPTFY